MKSRGWILGQPTCRNIEYIQNKLNHIIIPKIEFRDATVREALDFLKQKSVELDTTETDPPWKGVNIVLKLESRWLSPVPLLGPLIPKRAGNCPCRCKDNPVADQHPAVRGAPLHHQPCRVEGKTRAIRGHNRASLGNDRDARHERISRPPGIFEKCGWQQPDCTARFSEGCRCLVSSGADARKLPSGQQHAHRAKYGGESRSGGSNHPDEDSCT